MQEEKKKNSAMVSMQTASSANTGRMEQKETDQCDTKYSSVNITLHNSQWFLFVDGFSSWLFSL